MDRSLSRPQIAQLIHRILLREIGHDIEIDRLLNDERYARDVLFVCDACPGGELIPLAALFREASRGMPSVHEVRTPGHTAVAMGDWHDTSGFGMTQPPSRDDEADDAPDNRRDRAWLARWMNW